MLGLVAYEGSSDEEDNTDSEETPPTSNKRLESKHFPTPSSINTNSESHISDEEDSIPTSSSTKKPSEELHISDDESPTSSTDIPSKELHISDDEDFIGNNLESLQVSSSSTKVFHDLPAPTSHSINSSIPIVKPKSKSGGGGVKISIPSLDEFDEEEIEEDKPRKIKLAASVKGSGLFSILPKPRNEFLATPRQLPPRVPATTGSKASTSLVPRQSKSNGVQGKPNGKSNKPVPIENECNSDDDEVEGGDFFTIPDKKPEPDETVTVSDKTMEEYLKPIVPKKTAPSEPEHIPSDVSELDNEAGTSGMEMGPALPNDSNEIELNNDVLRKLGARKRKGEDLIVREVNASSLMPDSREWLAQLSEETTYRPSHKKHDGPTSQQKRKHQITYLAFQAKANELDLKNQWANNRQTKRQTQSKYGF